MPSDLHAIAASLGQVTDESLRHAVGDRSLRLGRALAAQHRVSSLAAEGADTLSATVLGDTGVYRSYVGIAADGEVLGSECTCPVGFDCKHVAATVLAAQELSGRGGSAARAPSHLRLAQPVAASTWERVLGEVIAGQGDRPAYVPLGLLVDVRPRLSRSRLADPEGPADPGVPAVRPVVPGKTGWVRTGVSWNQVQHTGYGGPALDPRQVEALRRLNIRNDRYGYYGGSEWLHLDDLGEEWADALRRCERTGIRLLAHQKTGAEVVLAKQPATLSFELARAAEGGITLTPTLVLPPELVERGADAAACWTIGSPPVGVVGPLDAKGLLLAALEPALDTAAARALAHGTLHVPEPDVGRFLTVAAPALARRFRVVSPDASVELAEPQPPRLLLAVEHQPGLRLALSWSFRYRVGEQTLDLPVERPTQMALRDPAAEATLLASVLALDLPQALLSSDAFTTGARLAAHVVLEGFAVVDALERTVPQVAALDGVEVVVSGEPVAYAEAPDAPVVHLDLTQSPAGADWFDLGVDVRVGTEKVPLGQLVTALAQRQEHLILPTGTWFRLDRPELEQLRLLLDEARALQDNGSGALRLSVYQVDLWTELETLGVVREQSERWAAMVAGLGGASVEPVAAPAALQAQLRPYQQQGFEWLTFLRRHELGGVLADDMGLGKTLQALAMILQERDDNAGSARAPWLVVAPTSVLATWASEAARFAPSLTVRVLAETARRRGAPVPESVAGADVVVTSYAVMRLDAEELRSVKWAGVVLDEAQAVKNHQSATYQAARRLPASARFVVSGTPMENNLMELWSLLSIAAPGLFPSPKAFAEHFRKPIESGSAPERLETLRRRIRPVMLRRTKQAVASDLPPKQEQQVRVELAPVHRRLYDRGLARERQRVLGLLDDPSRNRIAIFRSLTRLRQLSLHPGLVDPADESVACVKIDTLLEHLGPVVAEGHQALVFSQFTSFLKLVRDRLDASGMPYAYLDGRTRSREQAIEHFRSGSAPVFLISLKAGGTGLTLTEADYVFLLDPWWNPAVEAQAVDRTHRIGQQQPVNVYRLVAADTIEDKVVALQDRKRELFASVVDDGALAGGALSPDDIRGLLD